MNGLDAAEQVLRGAGHPLRVPEITRRALDTGLWAAHGKTPGQSIRSDIGRDIQRSPAASRLVRVKEGLFALREWGDADPVAATPGQEVSPGRDLAPPTEKPRAGTIPSLSFVQAAERVLSQCADRTPMHYAEITERALAEGIIETQGQTPEATMYAQILTDIQRAGGEATFPASPNTAKAWSASRRGSASESPHRYSSITRQSAASCTTDSCRWIPPISRI